MGHDAERPRVLPTPGSLVTDGRFNHGLFTSPLAEVNPLDAQILGPGGIRMPRLAKRLTLKEWQHFAVVDDEVYLSLAVFDAKRIALAQVIAYDRGEDRLHEHERRFAPWQVELPDELDHASARATRGRFSISAENRLAGVPSHHRLRFDAPADGGTPRVRGEVKICEDLAKVEPLVVCLPLPKGRAMYSHKAIAPCEGWIEVDGRRRELDPARAYSLVDIHKGYYPFEMKWFWATAAIPQPARGESPARLVGFNLTDNQVEDQASHNENALWVGGRLHPLPPVRFDLDRSDTMRPWSIRDDGGRVELEFAPDALRRVDIDLGPLRSRYRGPYGTFSGTIIDGAGQGHALDGAYGMCEDFYLRA
jgi:hypothetical protein